MKAPRLSDTSADVEQRQIEAWKRLSPADKAAMVRGLTSAVYALAMAGVRHRHPGASPREQFLRLAVVTLGPELAQQVYPEIAALEP